MYFHYAINNTDIVAGYYMNKEHWNSLYLEGNVPDDILKQMIDMSYELVIGKLTKKAFNEIIGGKDTD
jgi:predicted DNA-binding protein (MmcQ/YjbR family)